MNTTHLNTIGEKVIVKGGGSGGGKSGMKYYDNFDLNSSVVELASIGKFFDGDTLELELIGPMVFPPVVFPPEQQPLPFAFGVDLSQKMYFNGQMTTIAEMIEGMPLGVEITEEEFYHIPEDKVFDVSTAEGRKEAYETLFPLVSRYYPDWDSLPTKPWFKSLALSIGDDNGDRNIDVINYYGGNVLDFGSIQLEKKGNEYVLIAVAG
jgi:hypothetical protein